MSDDLNELNKFFSEDPSLWIEGIPSYQKNIVEAILEKEKDYSATAEKWLTASIENTFPFGGDKSKQGSGIFLEKIKSEIGEYLCGSPKYKKEREGLFGEKGIARNYVVMSLAVAIAPTLGVAAPFLAPAIALTLASLGKITINAWCAARQEAIKEAGKG